jgi:hypothetical protein
MPKFNIQARRYLFFLCKVHPYPMSTARIARLLITQASPNAQQIKYFIIFMHWTKLKQLALFLLPITLLSIKSLHV